MNSAAIGVVLAAAFVFVAKRLVGPSIDRLGDRVADWAFPPGRASTYRLARGITCVCRRIARDHSGAAAAAEAILADIDAIEAGLVCARPVTLAVSLVRPAIRSRISYWVTGQVLLGLILYWSFAKPALGIDNLGIPVSRRRRVVSVAFLLAAHAGLAFSSLVLSRGIPLALLGACITVWWLPSVLIMDLLAVRKWLDPGKPVVTNVTVTVGSKVPVE